MNKRDRVVYGERVQNLMPALMALKDSMTVRDDGMYGSSFTLEPAVAAPFTRALMRVEAELQRTDADTIGSDREEKRTYDQRAVDALVHLTLAVTGYRPPAT